VRQLSLTILFVQHQKKIVCQIQQQKTLIFNYVTQVSNVNQHSCVATWWENISLQLYYTDLCSKSPPPFCSHNHSISNRICCLSDNLIISCYVVSSLCDSLQEFFPWLWFVLVENVFCGPYKMFSRSVRSGDLAGQVRGPK